MSTMIFSASFPWWITLTGKKTYNHDNLISTTSVTQTKGNMEMQSVKLHYRSWEKWGRVQGWCQSQGFRRCQVAEAGRRRWQERGPRLAWERGESSIVRHGPSAGRLTGITDTREATAGGVATGELGVDRGERPSYMCIVYTGVCRQWWSMKIMDVTNSLDTGKNYFHIVKYLTK